METRWKEEEAGVGSDRAKSDRHKHKPRYGWEPEVIPQALEREMGTLFGFL